MGAEYTDNNVTRQKAMQFAIRIYKLCKYLIDEKREIILAKQILKSGTSIGANLAEAKCAISDNDYLAKVYISYKECSETLFWLDLFKNIDLIKQDWVDSIKSDGEEMIRLLASTIKSTKSKMDKNKKNEKEPL